MLKIFLKGQGQRSRSGQWSKPHVSGLLAVETILSKAARPNSAKTRPMNRRRYCWSITLILSTGQGQAEVTKGHHMQKSYANRVTHVIWLISDVELDGNNDFDI